MLETTPFTADGLPTFFAYFASALVLFAVFIAVYVAITPYREIKLIRENNTAAAVTLGGAMFGFMFPLSSAIAFSVNLTDMLMWGAIALAVQLLAFALVWLLVPKLKQDIVTNKMAPALLLAFVSIAIGMINAACMTY